MANFFRYFPKTAYIDDENSALTLVTNIMSRVKFLDDIKENISSYYLYDVKEGDSPEIVALKFYGSMERHWIILLLNDIIDPQFDWYKNYETFNRYVEEKYSSLGGINYAKATTKKYLISETRTVQYPTGPVSVVGTYETDVDTWASTAATSKTLTLTNSNNYVLTIEKSKSTQSIYDWEVEENEKKRSIKILKKEYVDAVESELRDISNIIPVSAV